MNLNVSPKENRTLKQALDQHLKKLGTTEASYTDRWYWMRIPPFSIPVFNFKARQKGIKFHDLHHVLTGYKPNFLGEAEISAWEMASGWGNHPFAIFYALLAIPTGMLISPRAVLKAFLKGKRNKNLYQEKELNSWMELTVEQARKKLKIDGRTNLKGNWKDYLELAGWVIAGFATLMITGTVWFLPWMVGNRFLSKA